MSCEDCGGCTDDNCGGSCGERWCGGAYMGKGCDRCPEKVPKTITVKKLRDRMTVNAEIEIMVRCNSSSGVGHKGTHHWNHWKAGQ